MEGFNTLCLSISLLPHSLLYIHSSPSKTNPSPSFPQHPLLSGSGCILISLSLSLNILFLYQLSLPQATERSMGNGASCVPSIVSNTGVVKVLCSDGRVEVYTRPVKAAELMMEKPGHFVCNSTDFKVGQRIAGLSADEELQMRQLYFLLPMEMLYSVLTHDEISSLSHKASRTVKTGSSSNNFSRIFPLALSDFCMFPSEAKTDDDHHPDQTVQRHCSRQRSWTPALETIAETPSRL